MYDKYLIVGEAFRNVEKDGRLTGFQLGLRLPYYRGVVLSLVGDTILAVDGEKVPAEKMTVTVGGRTFPVTGWKTNPWPSGSSARWASSPWTSPAGYSRANTLSTCSST